MTVVPDICSATLLPVIGMLWGTNNVISMHPSAAWHRISFIVRNKRTVALAAGPAVWHLASLKSDVRMAGLNHGPQSVN